MSSLDELQQSLENMSSVLKHTSRFLSEKRQQANQIRIRLYDIWDAQGQASEYDNEEESDEEYRDVNSYKEEEEQLREQLTKISNELMEKRELCLHNAENVEDLHATLLSAVDEKRKQANGFHRIENTRFGGKAKDAAKYCDALAAVYGKSAEAAEMIAACFRELSQSQDGDPDWLVYNGMTQDQYDQQEQINRIDARALTTEFSTEEPKERKAIIPGSSGTWLGKPGESEFIPQNKAAQKLIQIYGRKTVKYTKDHPDFSPFTTHDSPWGRLGCSIEIGHMTMDRKNVSAEYDEKGNFVADDVTGNFTQADQALADKINEANPKYSVTAEDVKKWRTSAKPKLTWHEVEDKNTMQLVPTVIHAACKHSGGVSESKYSQGMGNYADSHYDDVSEITRTGSLIKR